MSSLVLPEYLSEQIKASILKTEDEAQANPVGEQEEADDVKLAKQLPEPTGYKMLIGLPKIETKYESGIIKADSIVRNDEIATCIGFVIKMGPDCYKDPVRFPSGAYCKVGDFILLRVYSGTRFKLYDVEFRMVNDDSVEAVVQDPRGYSRV